MTRNSDIILWCEWQGADEEGIYCTAHIAEGRVHGCPYDNAEKRLEAEYPCSDYQHIPDT